MSAAAKPAQHAIEIVRAGAGAGKTYRVTEVIREAIAGGLPPEGVLATTFTKKAAAELVERARVKLLEDGRVGEAAILDGGLIGTVNAVCGRLLSDFAFAAGLSPSMTVLPEADQAAAFATAAAGAFEKAAAALEPIADRLSCSARAIRRPGYASPTFAKEWRQHVADIVQRARVNLMDDDALQASAASSLKSLMALLPPPDARSPEAMDAALVAAIRQALEGLGAGDGTKVTTEAIEVLRSAKAEAEATGGDVLPYAAWARIAKTKASAKMKAVMAPLLAIATLHDTHPRLRGDLAAFVQGCFDCAREALTAYEAHKRREGLIDFIDQEALAYRLLANGSVSEALSDRFGLMVVDEFQDTSPLQLALFTRLVECVGRAVWVGDSKQAIYGFRDSDPTLMQAVVDVIASEAPGEMLDTSRRSRPDLVAFANWLFEPSFRRMGMPEGTVALKPVRQDREGHLAPLRAWRAAGRNADLRSSALAAGIARLLNEPDATPVEDPISKAMRPLQPGDVAVLCRNNDALAALAAALSARGVRVAMEWPGLLSTDEAVLATAALRFLVRRDDTLAAAEILHKSGGADPRWLDKWLPASDVPEWRSDPRFVRMDAARGQLIDLTPLEALDLALAAADVVSTVRRWPEPEQRLANLDAVRALAASYQDSCRSARLAGTPAGFLAFLAGKVDGSRDLDKQSRAVGAGAVNLLTYHGAKGLEWPVVVLSDLDSAPEPRMHEATVEGPEEGFNARRPLDGRHIRLWPWPYGAQRTNVGLDARVAATPEAQRHGRALRLEEMRLMYVGVTRARDYLILAGEPGRTRWLDTLTGPDDRPRMTFPESGTGAVDLGGGKKIAVPVAQFAADLPDAFRGTVERFAAALPEGAPPAYPRARVSPSSAASDGASATDARIVSIGPRLPLKRAEAMDLLGNAVHAFLAADAAADAPGDRVASAKRLLDAWGVSGYVNPEDLVAASDRLSAFVRERYGADAIVLREWPLHMRTSAGQEIAGLADYLVRHSGGWAIVDHKSFPGAEEAWEGHARGHLGQLAAYRFLLERATDQPVTELAVHMPIVGKVVVLGQVSESAK